MAGAEIDAEDAGRARLSVTWHIRKPTNYRVDPKCFFRSAGLATGGFGSILPRQMRRLPVLLCAAAFFLSGCDFFSTRDFRPKPNEIHVLPGLADEGDSVSFLATEAVWRAGAAAPEQILSKRRVTFAFVKDSGDGTDSLKILHMRIRDDSTGALVEEGIRVLRFTSAGVALPGAESGGARYFPVKRAAVPSQAESAASALAVSAAAASAPAASASDTDAFLALPTLLIEGWSESVSMGVFTVQRLQSALDTLTYRDASEEAWVISESVMDGSSPVSSGRYWYGASGLLKAQQSWDDFDWRDGNGQPGKSKAGTAPAVSLRRSVQRL